MKMKRYQSIICLLLVFAIFILPACSLNNEYNENGEEFYEEEKKDGSVDSDEENKNAKKENVPKSKATSKNISKYFADGAIREPQVKLKGNGEDTVTILVFMNGSNLESESGEATTDLTEMVAAGSSDKVNLIVQTMGTKIWDKKYGIASDRSQIYKVNSDGLTLLKDNLGQQDCTKEEALSDFIIWGVQNFPADRYVLLLTSSRISISS